MPHVALRRGDRALSLRFQALHLSVEVASPVTEVLDRLRYLATDAEQPVTASQHVRFEVLPEGAELAVTEDGVRRATADTAADVLAVLYPRVYELALAHLARHIILHAACATVAGRRLLLVGPPGAGKSTLATALLLDGADVGGDELTVTEGRASLPFPRNFHLKPGTDAVLPGLGDLSALPAWEHDGHIARAFAPSRLGRPWRVTWQEVELILFLEPDHGGVTRLLPLPAYEAAQRLMRQAIRPTARGSDWIGELCRLVDDATVARLQVGTIDSAVAAVTSAANDLGTVPRSAVTTGA